MAKKEKVIIFDTTLRDGEQAPGASLTSDEKLEVAYQLEKLGVDVIEAGFPIASPDDFNAVNMIARAMKKTYAFLRNHSRRIPDIRICAPIVLDDYCGDGYGCPTPAGGRAMKLFEERENIRLEPVYTAKACAALLDFIRTRAQPTDTILYWHTYNSVDLSGAAASVDPRRLPGAFHRFFPDVGSPDAAA